MNNEPNDKDVNDKVQAFLDDPYKIELLAKHFEVFQTISNLNQKDQTATPTNITEKFYSDEMRKKYNDNKKRFMRNHKAEISRELNILRDKLKVVTFETNLRDGRNRKYTLTSLGGSLIKNRDLFQKITKLEAEKKIGPKKKIPNTRQLQTKEFHSRQIRNAIDQLIDELPLVDWYGAYTEKPNETGRRRYDGEDLFVERSNVLYNDLENHLVTFMSFRELKKLMGDFKQISKEVNESRKEVQNLIIEELEKQLQLKYNETSDGIDVFCKILLNWVNNALKYRIDKGDTKDFKENFIDFSSEHKEMSVDDIDVIKIYIGGSPMMTIKNTDDSSDRINHLETILKNLMSNIETIPFFIENRKEKSMIEDLEDIRTRIISGLKKEKEIPVYPGDCPYTGKSR